MLSEHDYQRMWYDQHPERRKLHDMHANINYCLRLGLIVMSPDGRQLTDSVTGMTGTDYVKQNPMKYEQACQIHRHDYVPTLEKDGTTV